MLSETIIIFLIASSSALCGIVLKYSFESKCRNVDICCIHITRDIDNEVKEEHDRLEHGVGDNPLPTMRNL